MKDEMLKSSVSMLGMVGNRFGVPIGNERLGVGPPTNAKAFHGQMVNMSEVSWEASWLCSMRAPRVEMRE